MFRAKGDWFIGAQGSAANYQVLGATAEDDLVLDTLGVRGFASSGLGAVLMHDSRDNEDMPLQGWFRIVNNLAYRESLGGSSSHDAYRVDFRTFWKHGSGHVLAVRQYDGARHRSPGLRGCNGETPVALDRSIYPTLGAGVHFVIKPKERMNVNLEYAHGIGDSQGVYLKLGYAW